MQVAVMDLRQRDNVKGHCEVGGIECAYPAHKIGSNFLKMAKGFALTCQRRIKVPYGELISQLEDRESDSC